MLIMLAVFACTSTPPHTNTYSPRAPAYIQAPLRVFHCTQATVAHLLFHSQHSRIGARLCPLLERMEPHLAPPLTPDVPHIYAQIYGHAYTTLTYMYAITIKPRLSQRESTVMLGPRLGSHSPHQGRRRSTAMIYTTLEPFNLPPTT